MSSLSDLVFAADDLDHRVEEIPEWGVKLELRTPTGTERSAMMRFALADKAQADDWSLLWPIAIAACAHDPETGESVFTAADVERLQDKNAAVLQRVGDICLALAGMKPESIEEGKDSSS